MNNFWPVKVLRFVTLFFLLAIALGMWLYPGGNIHDPKHLGYSFTHNFLSDLGGDQSHSDEINFLSSFFFNLGMFLLLLSVLDLSLLGDCFLRTRSAI